MNPEKSYTSSLITNFLGKPASVEIKNYMNRRFVGTIQIGSQNRPFDVILDTGSSTLWVGDHNQHSFLGNSYDCAQSKTCNAFKNFEKNITYGSGSIKGYKITDHVKIGSAILQNFSMLLVKEADAKLKGIHGILGLSLGRGSSGFPTVLEQLKANGLIKVSMFSMYLGDDAKATGGKTGEIIFGGYDPKYAKSEFKFVKIKNAKDSMFWTTDMRGLGLGTTVNVSQILPVVFDSGTSLIILPEEIIKKIIVQAKSQGIHCHLNQNRKKYQCDCSARDKLGDLIFYFDEASFNIPATSYVEFNYGSCDLLLDNLKGIGSNKGIIGDVFLKHYYTMYSAENNTIGFAQAVPITNIPFGVIILLLVAGLLIISVIVFFCTKPKNVNNKPWKSTGITIGGGSGKSRLLDNDGNAENANY